MSLTLCPECHAKIDPLDTEGSTLRCRSCGADIKEATVSGNDADSGTVHAKSAEHDASVVGRIGHYRLIEGLGSGSFGAVWKAQDEKLDRIVAIKVPRQGLLSKSQMDDFLREARAIAKLSHPGIVSVYEIGQTRSGPFIVTEFIEGADLRHELQVRSLSISEAVRLSIALGEALQHAHQHGIIHRDLKPANVMVDREGRPHVMDFGLAKQVSQVDVKKTVDGQVMGTPAYMSPEQARGDSRHVDGRSDVYSLGVMLFEFLTGELPFRGRAAMLLQQVIADEPPAPRTLNAAVPLDLQNICLKCLEKDPDRRYQSAATYVADLNAFLNHEPVSAKPTTRFQRFNKWCRRNPVVASLTALAFSFLIALCILSTTFLIRERGLRTSVREALTRESDALREAQQVAVDLKRQRDGLAAAKDLLTSVQNSVTEQARRYAVRLYAHELRDCDAWLRDGNVLLAEQRLAEMESGDPNHEFLCWAWDYLHESVAQRFSRVSTLRTRIDRLVSNRDGSEVFVLFQGGVLQRWELSAPRVVQLAVPFSANARFNDMDFNAQSGTLAVITQSGKLFVQATDGAPMQAFDGDSSNAMIRVRIRPDGKQLAALGSDGTVRILQIPSLQQASQWQTATAPLSMLAWHPTDNLIVTASDRTVRFWDSRDGKQRGSAQISSSISCMDWTVDGRSLLAGGGFEAWLVDPLTFQIERFAVGTEGTAAIVPGDTTDTVWILSQKGVLSVWSLATRQRLADHTVHEGAGSAMCVSDDRLRLFASSVSGEVVVVNWKEPDRIEPKRLRHDASVRRIDWHPDSTRLAAADWTGKFSVWDVASETRLFEVQVCESDKYCESAMWSPDGTAIATSSTDGTVSIWDAKQGERIATMKGHQGPVYGIAWHPSLPRLASSGPDGVVRIWDTKSFHEIEAWNVGSLVEQVSWSPDGNRLYAVGVKFAVRDMQTGQLLVDEPSYGGLLLNVVVHPDQSRIAIGGSSGIVTLIDQANLNNRTEWRVSPTELRGLTWSPDGKCLVTTDLRGAVHVWQPDASPNHAPLVALRADSRNSNGARAWCAAFSPNGHQLAVSDESGAIDVWSIR